MGPGSDLQAQVLHHAVCRLAHKRHVEGEEERSNGISKVVLHHFTRLWGRRGRGGARVHY